MTTVFHPELADLGTPARCTAEQVTLEIDGTQVSVPVGTSVLRAAALAGIQVPRLCATDSLAPVGGCRLCLVEITGRKGYPASCTTPAQEGMCVRTQSPQLQHLRQDVLALTLSDHPLDCLTCSANGRCELQDVAASVGLRELSYGVGAAAGAHHLAAPADNANPYFRFDPAKCIVCSRCVRACDTIQGSFALTLQGRGFDTRVVAGQDQPFMASECVSCGTCLDACPTAALQDLRSIALGQPTHVETTTCAYCGVGCSLTVEMKGPEVLRLLPAKDGPANAGHACVKGRFAWGYATHPDRVTQPMIRHSTQDPWQVVSWDEAISHTASEFRRLQAAYGRGAIGAVASSRCTNEETYLVQKLVRAAFGNNNIDNCARVCHAPTGYGLAQTFGTSAGTQSFSSVDQAEVILLIGANPSAAHPVFASRLKKRLRQGARLIVIDPRQIDLVDAPHIHAALHLQLHPGSNVALLNALAHVLVTEGLLDEAFIASRCDADAFAQWRQFVAQPGCAPEAVEAATGVPATAMRAAARLYASGSTDPFEPAHPASTHRPRAAIYYGLGVTEHAQGSSAVMAIANLAMATGNIGREGCGVNPLRGQNNVQGACDMGTFPHQLPGYDAVADARVRQRFEAAWGVALPPEPGLRTPRMLDAAVAGHFKGLYLQGDDLVQSEPHTAHVVAALQAMECVVLQDLFLNETARYAHVFLPGASFLEKDGTFTNAERRISRVRRVLPPKAGLAEWQVTARLSTALGYPMTYSHPSEIMAEIAALTPSLQGVSYAKLAQHGSLQWPCNYSTPVSGTPTMHINQFARGLGRFVVTPYEPIGEQASADFPLILGTGRILTQYNVGAQTRRTANVQWDNQDLLQMHPQDARERGIGDGDWVHITSRCGATRLRASLSTRLRPGTAYTTFHFPASGTNRLTTDIADWATDCPQYKVTAVQVAPLCEST